MDNYKEIIDGVEELSEETKTSYKNTIKSIIKRCGDVSVDDIVLNPDNYKKSLDMEKNIKSRKLYYSTILALFKHLKLKDICENEYNKWKESASDTMKEVEYNEKNHVSTKRQDDGMVSWDDIIKKRDEIDIGSLDHLLLTIYISFTRRQEDYASVRIYNGIKDMDENINYINLSPLDGREAYIHIKRYKTGKIHGIFEEDIPDILKESLLESLKREPREYLFGNYVKGNSFQKWCNRQLKRIFEKKDMSVNILRHSISDYINNIPKIKYSEREKYAKRMGHSVTKQLQYVLYN